MSEQTRPAPASDVFSVVDPRTDEVLARYPTMTDDEVRDAIARAHAAFQRWSRLDVGRRATILRRVADLLEARGEELGLVVAREMGKPPADAAWEPGVGVPAQFRFFADHGAEFLADQRIDFPEGHAVVVKQALGVILGIVPWNAPYLLIGRVAAPNLIVGNTVLLKPAPQCPESAAAVQDLMLEAGLPEGVFQVVRSGHDQTELILGDPRIQGVSFTGSRAGGAVVAGIAGRNLKRVSLELGGSDPFLVLSAENLDATLRDAVGLRVLNAGQVCSAPKRFIVADEVFDSFLEGYLNLMDEWDQTRAGTPPDRVQPMASAAAADRLQEQLARAVRQGATLIGARRVGNAFAPGLLVDVPDDADVHGEELFGPVGVLYRARDEDDAVAIANRTSYGLGSYVYTDDPEQARRVADRVEAGMSFINRGFDVSPHLGFGGVKASGYGHAGGRWAAEEFMNQKFVVTT
jgi:succinate-semialdehyde dehydrogenase/glutarate-semialdehyde dehydrogenase